MRRNNLQPAKLAVSMVILGATGAVFCVPAVYALSVSEPVTASVILLLVTASGVGGLWFGVSKGLSYLGDAVFGR